MAHFYSSVRRRRARYQAASAAVIGRAPLPRLASGDAAAAALEDGGILSAAPARIALQKRKANACRTVKAMAMSPDNDLSGGGEMADGTPGAGGDAPDLLPGGTDGGNARRPAADQELKRAKEAAEAANDAKTRYLVAVSHEIRAPLNAIYGYAQLLERGGAVSPVEAGGVIRRSAEHLTNLIEGILDISRIEGGAFAVRNDLVELPTLLAHVLDMFRMQTMAKGIELRYVENGRVPRFVRTDEKRLSQILINLLSNAVKYTQQGSVTVTVTYRSQVAEVVIADTGIGIAGQDLDRVFEPFERGGSAEAALQPGIGLGLAITRALSRILGGEIAATSRLGVGSCFTLSLFLPEPFAAPADAAEYRQIIGYHGPRRTVLVIDDQLSQVHILDSLLRGLDFVVYAAGNGAEGLELAQRCRPDIVLLDIEMPGASGWDIAARLRATHGDAIRIIMVSANPDAPRLPRDAAPAHDAYVAKPVDQKKLLTAIGRSLQLVWDFAGDGAGLALLPAAGDAPPALPDAAGEWVEPIRRFAQAGHIRKVAAAIAQLVQAVPDAAPAAARMREYVDNFDLPGLVKMIDGQRSD